MSKTQCQICGKYGPASKVRFFSVVGILMEFRTFSVNCDMCRACLRDKFVEYTLTTLALGWWGVASLLATPFVVGYNLVSFSAGSLALARFTSLAETFSNREIVVGELQ